MPVSQMMEPGEIRKSGMLRYKDTPLLSYRKSFSEEKEEYGEKALKEFYYDMVMIREFEQMFASIRKEGKYKDVIYEYTGPAHLYIGQESVAVGQAYHLGIDDFIFGTHRNHGEVIAKALRCIRLLPDIALQKIMAEVFDGEILKKLKRLVPEDVRTDIKSLSEDFVLYLLISELFGKKTGSAKGLSNSMHLFFKPFGIYPNNAIVGASAPLAAGAALYKKVNNQDGIVIANLGDGALGCGPVFESMNFSAMDQYKKLWESKGGLPILFFFSNNGYGMGGQTVGETMAYETLARVGVAVNPEQMHSERVDGFNPLAVADAMKRKIKTLTDGDGPAMLDVITYRFCAHSASDKNSYRSDEELKKWMTHDCIKEYRKKLVSYGITTDEETRNTRKEISERILRITRLACDESISPRMDLKKEKDAISKYIFSNERRVEKQTNVSLSPREEIRKKSRSGLVSGKMLPSNEAVTFSDALFESIIDKFRKDDTLVAYGQENRDWGGTFGVYQGLSEVLPYHRLFNAPISESIIVGSAAGYAMSGGRVIAELMYCDFMGRAGDELFNQLAKWQAMSAGILKMPAVIRMAVGSKYGAQHSQDLSAFVAHVPGLKLCFPSTPYDAKGLMNTALAFCDPVVFFESQRLYNDVEVFHEGGVPEGYYEIPFGKGDIKIEGNDVTILAVGGVLSRVVSAIRTLKEKYNVSGELFDPRTLVPFDYEGLIQSVRKTGRLILVSDACERGSYLHTIASKITYLLFDKLKHAPVVLGAKNWIVPCIELEHEYFPQPEEIVAVAGEMMSLKGLEYDEELERQGMISREARGV